MLIPLAHQAHTLAMLADGRATRKAAAKLRDELVRRGLRLIKKIDPPNRCRECRARFPGPRAG